MRLNLHSARPYPVEVALSASLQRVEPIEVHTAETQSELESGQSRKFFAMADEHAVQDEERGDDERYLRQLKAEDPGMTRIFLAEPATEVVAIKEGTVASHGGALEPGQSIRFGPEPPPETTSLD